MTRQNFDLFTRHIQSIRQPGNQNVVGTVVNRRGIQGYFKPPVVFADNL